MATRRARRRDQKQERGAEILLAAKNVFARKAWSELAMDEVAREAGLAKSTLFLYFPTKEALFLAVLEMLMKEFFEDLAEGLSEGHARWTPQHAARSLAALTEKHALMSRLLMFLHPVLEQNSGEPAILRFREFLIGSLLVHGEAVEERLAVLPGDGARLLLRWLALVAGLRQMTEPAALLRSLYHRAELAPLDVDFRIELMRTLTSLISGMISIVPSEAGK